MFTSERLSCSREGKIKTALVVRRQRVTLSPSRRPFSCVNIERLFERLFCQSQQRWPLYDVIPGINQATAASIKINFFAKPTRRLYQQQPPFFLCQQRTVIHCSSPQRRKNWTRRPMIWCACWPLFFFYLREGRNSSRLQLAFIFCPPTN